MNNTSFSSLPVLPGEPHGYWEESRQPMYSAALVLPFVLVYELGIVFLRSDVINGGDAILLNLGGPWLARMGLPGSSVSILALIGFFAFMQAKDKAPWTIKPNVLIGMFFESLFFAFLLLIMLGYVIRYLPPTHDSRSPVAVVSSPREGERAAAVVSSPLEGEGRERGEPLAQTRDELPAVCAASPVRAEQRSKSSSRAFFRDMVLYCGAGVYEELVFRVFLLGLLMLMLTKLFQMEHAYAAAWSVILGALIFSAFHHIGGQPFGISVFMQRVFAGLYFAAIYYNRSFGVAAASHALYDILIGLNQH